FMGMAIEEALRAEESGEVPVGAVLVLGEEVLARAHNRTVCLNDPTAHAEVLAIRRAARIRKNYRLPGTTLYVTLEPCILCAGAVLQARIDRLVYGARDPKGGAVESLYRLLEDSRLNHEVRLTGGVLERECGEILSGFFRKKRIR
ncbi:MAG TPA: tRNA adenosine(34) deaminase TadA, partial [Syntrophales bacterium]|nr:tRNA adenosine(34) deaminase TadA [Syntrophales bacterium]